ncbi:MAG: type II toxin-antitoxin system VapC family toxin [Chloroflexota bacterium]|nr:type II toxin-antitoxin system VapC family toxin [Chloroflexota bacterium]
MKLLLDTHIFLWFILGDTRIPTQTLESIRRPENEVYLSIVSLWEVIVKHQLSKLTLPEPPETYIPLQRERHRIDTLPLDESSVRRLAGLPPLHRDPFDRMLICQALEQDLVIVTLDQQIRDYQVKVL